MHTPDTLQPAKIPNNPPFHCQPDRFQPNSRFPAPTKNPAILGPECCRGGSRTALPNNRWSDHPESGHKRRVDKTDILAGTTLSKAQPKGLFKIIAILNVVKNLKPNSK